MHDNIGTKVKRSLNEKVKSFTKTVVTYSIVGREESVVNTDDNVFVDSMDFLGDGLDVTDTEERVGHELEPDHLGVWLDGSDNVVGVTDVDHRELDAVLGGDFVEVAVGASVEIVSGDSMVSVLKLKMIN